MDDALTQILQDWLQEAPIALIAPLLETRAQQDWQRSRALGICPANLSLTIRDRLQLCQSIYPAIQQLCQTRLQLPILSLALFWDLWLPLAMRLIEWRKAQSQPLIQGFLGAQGTGKTTLTVILALILEHMGYRTASFSIDDLYKTYSDRQHLQRQDPRLDRRGPPGTHDIDLGIQVLTDLKQGISPIQLPRFDKSAWQGVGDRTTPETILGADIVLFEGWFVGVRPIDPQAFETAPPPIITPADRAFARDINERLRDYLPLWALLDRLIVLYLPDYCLSLQWRQQAEQQMIAQGKPGMTDAEIADFVEYFWRSLHPQLFIPPLLSQPERVDLVLEINADHLPGRIYQPSA